MVVVVVMMKVSSRDWRRMTIVGGPRLRGGVVGILGVGAGVVTCPGTLQLVGCGSLEGVRFDWDGPLLMRGIEVVGKMT